jgi:LacI family transcriptional regulator
MTDNLSRNLTLEDVARLSGVSRSTVSRVVNNHPNVSRVIRQQVLQIIDQTGYHPNEAARTLASQRSWMIGLVLPESISALFVNPYFAILMQGIAQACNQNQYTLSFFLINTKEDEEKIFPRISRKGLLDGIILQSGNLGDHLAERLAKSDIPLIIAGRPFHLENVSYIDVDNIHAAQTAVSHLIRLGKKRIATISGPLNTTVGIDRLQGYKQALLENRIPLDESLIIEGDFREEGGYYAARKLFPAEVDAIFTANDAMGMGVIRAAEEIGLRIPQDLALVGFDDIKIPLYKDIPLTTIRQPVLQFGVRAVEALVDLIETGSSQPKRIILDTELVIRKTCGAYQQEHA